ncbi:MAG: ATP-binding cassette domain-containing protein [Candidatus Sumerlaeaceae bacterium]|nr:ATP-binding cassette domain-containing protein [Candidatus Sumerlaeaceae bacterium]
MTSATPHDALPDGRPAGFSPVLRVNGLTKHFPVRKGLFGRDAGAVRAVDGVSFELGPRETLGLVGESGCGKTTTGRLILQLIRPTAGEVRLLDSPDLTTLSNRQLLPWRRRMQMIFQDPYSSLNPRMTVGSIIGEALTIHRLAHGARKTERVKELLAEVGLNPNALKRFPHEFSGGQRQRIGVARALAVEPHVIIADEPVSALDVSIQSQIINLLQRLQEEHGLSYVFIAHDLSVVGHISHRVAVMYLGRIVEIGPKLQLFETPRHPYTQALLAAVPKPDPAKRGPRALLQGDVPSPLNPPSGCAFHPRCPRRFAPCDKIVPRLLPQSDGVQVACHLYDPEHAPST